MIGILGGTGPQGQGLARRLALAGLEIVIGSRDPAKAAEAAATLTESGDVHGDGNASLPDQCDTLLVAVPYKALRATLEPLQDSVKDTLVVSMVNHLTFDTGPQAAPVAAGSAAQEIASLLPGARVTTGFNNLSALNLANDGHRFAEDVLVCGDDDDAVAQTIALVEQLDGLRGVAAGPLRNAATIEALTAVVISINKTYNVTAGVRIAGL